MTSSTVITTERHETRFPIVVSDPTSGWTKEGEEIDISDPLVDELVCRPSKLAGLTVCSSELIEDSDPAALEVVGSGLVRDLQTRLDAAFFGSSVENGPNGLESLAGVQHVDVDVFDLEDLDWAAEAISYAESAGATLTSFVCSPSTMQSLLTLKTADGWVTPLLGTDPSSPTKRSVFGVPLIWSPAVADNVIWALPRSKSFVVIRNPVSVESDRSAFWSSDRIGIRAKIRVGFAWPHEAAIIRIGSGGS